MVSGLAWSVSLLPSLHYQPASSDSCLRLHYNSANRTKSTATSPVVSFNGRWDSGSRAMTKHVHACR